MFRNSSGARWHGRRLGERVGDRARLDRWVLDRRARQVRVDWQFRTVDARVKLKGLYPQNSA